ncbi:TPA: hypothetical protein ACNVTV_003545 [Citrobacter freundii]|uniref:hypothetical protein n=1 Tax=Citrobacter freundii TaxID=546 RepID=UPI0019678485|nr:hypothetical protein [Citrobacter freundii]QSB86601.1 hypothetical protein JW296_03425 [Citrobacter freundii]CAE6252546.1 hypothetical protein AI2642V1_3175 [Citrobacter freundii]CAH3591930.1 hypothetical protein AI2642V1_3175 [Citrobacter freundii]
MSKPISLEEVLAGMNDTARKNYAMTELLMQTFSAFVISTGNKEAVVNFIKSTSSTGELAEAHKHAQNVFLNLLDSIKVIPQQKN